MDEIAIASESEGARMRWDQLGPELGEYTGCFCLFAACTKHSVLDIILYLPL